MANSKHKPPEGLYLEGRFNGGFLALRVWGLIFGGAYTWSSLCTDVPPPSKLPPSSPDFF